MIAQYTLLTTLALHHVVIGCSLILVLLGLNKLCNSSAEMRSWVLMAAFITSTLAPLTLPQNQLPQNQLPQNQLVRLLPRQKQAE